MSTTLVIVAKAGGSDEASENTLEALASALSLSAPPGYELAAEVDVRSSADGHAVLLHDKRLERTTNGVGAVAGHSLVQLRGLRAGQNNERIATLEEAIEATHGHQLVIEAHDGGARMHEALLRALRRANKLQRERLIIASERSELVYAIRLSETGVRTAATAGEAKRKLLYDRLGLARWSPRWPLWIVPQSYRGFNVISAPFINNARGYGAEVWTYVVNDAARAVELAARGVTGIFTTQPRSLLEEIVNRCIYSKDHPQD